MGKIVTLFALFLLIASCGAGKWIPECPDGGTYCKWGAEEVCCPAAFSYCGIDGTDCPSGHCCSNPPR